ncbi:hypothetical protein SprV_0501989800 [Sparganum proliferum]
MNQGCVLAPNLFNLMFSATPLDANRIEHPRIRVDYRMDGQLNRRRMYFQSYVSTTTVREHHFAEDLAPNMTTEKEIQRITYLFAAAAAAAAAAASVCGNFDLTVNTDKTVVMC